MSEERVLVNHDEIRTWAAALMGTPALVDVSPAAGMQPQLRIIFGQAAYQDQDQAERPINAGGYELVEWDEWFKIFDDLELALVVSPAEPGILDSSHEFVKRN